MSDLPTASAIKDLVSLFAPGMIILWVRSRVQAGPKPDLQERVVAYAIASTAYFAAISPFFFIHWGWTLPVWLWSLLHYATIPLALGWAVAAMSQRGWEYSVADRLGLKFAHDVPTAWDFTFHNLQQDVYVLVTLKDGSQIAGRWTKGSFASSSREERDLLLGEIWDVSKTGKWTPIEPLRSVLLCGADIHYIEII